MRPFKHHFHNAFDDWQFDFALEAGGAFPKADRTNIFTFAVKAWGAVDGDTIGNTWKHIRFWW